MVRIFAQVVAAKSIEKNILKYIANGAQRISTISETTRQSGEPHKKLTNGVLMLKWLKKKFNIQVTSHRCSPGVGY
jgi:hypothetical protein